MFDLHTADLGWPVPLGHGFDHAEADVADPTLNAFAMAQRDFPVDEFLVELDVTATVASGLFGRWYDIFE
jgi:hypothetical protein